MCFSLAVAIKKHRFATGKEKNGVLRLVAQYGYKDTTFLLKSQVFKAFFSIKLIQVLYLIIFWDIAKRIV